MNNSGISYKLDIQGEISMKLNQRGKSADLECLCACLEGFPVQNYLICAPSLLKRLNIRFLVHYSLLFNFINPIIYLNL